MRSLCLVLLLALAGCGARSGLEVPDDAGDDVNAVDAADATPFHSFPCRWFSGETIELGASRSARAATASVELERVAIVADAADARPDRQRVFLLVPRSGPILDRTLEVPSMMSLAPRRGGWLATARPGVVCELRWLTPDFEVERTLEVPSMSWCRVEPIDADQVVVRAVTSLVPRAETISVLSPDDGTLREIVRDVPPGRVTLDGDGNVYLLEAAGVGLMMLRVHTADGRVLEDAWPVARPIGWSIAPDRLLGGAVVLSERESGRWVLERLRVRGGEIAHEPIAEIDREPSVTSDLATNETEALFSLDDGSFVAIPLHSGSVRVIEPPREPGEVHRVVIAPGASIAGQTWVQERGSGDVRVLYRSLTCNR